MSNKTPTYRYHKARDCAVVTIGGHDHYLGAFNSFESREAYHRLLGEHLAERNRPKPIPVQADTPFTVVELIAAYWKHAKSYYVKNGKPTSEIDALRQALRFLKTLYGTSPACEFTPKKLKAVREVMITHRVKRDYKAVDPETGDVVWKEKLLYTGLCRRVINKHIGRIRRVFAWGVEEELVNVEVHAALQRVAGLKKHKSEAREKTRIKPVSAEAVAKVMPIVPPVIRAMIEIQQLIGARPQEVVLMRVEDIQRRDEVWEYRPSIYKTEHHNENSDPDRERVLFIGPRGQALLKPFIAELASGYVFSPIRSEEGRNVMRRENRKTKMTPSQAERKPKGRKRAPLRDHYDVITYRRAIRRACEKLKIPVWAPNQLRHSRLTEIRQKFGLEASRVVGGHTEVGTTQIYAEQDRELARDVMMKVG